MWALSEKQIFATDYTNASRTMLFNIHTLEWDEELLNLFGIPRAMLPEVHPSGHLFGYASETIVGARIPICGVAGDQQAALFGQLCTEKGTIKNTYGTGCFMLMNTGDVPVKSQNGLITTLAACISDRPCYVLEGSVFVGGAVVKWLRDEMRLIRKAEETERYATAVPDTNGVYLLPAFVGLGAPHWDSDIRGTVIGLTRATKKEHFIRAALESIAYQVHDILRAMEEDLGVKIGSLFVDGGASANNFLMQFQSDILGVDVIRPKVIEVTALGAAYLAGLKVGYWRDIDDIRKNIGVERIFKPEMDAEKKDKLLKGWNKCISAARGAL
jgi:glycerol kinase